MAQRLFSSAFSAKAKPFRIFIEGNIACGKSHFLKVFANSPVFEVLSEPICKWRNIDGKYNLLDQMYADPSRWSFAFQSYVQLTMFQNSTIRSKKKAVVCERSIFSARYIFIENLYKHGFLSPTEYTILDEFFEELAVHCPVDLVVYLETSPEVCFNRLKQRNRPEEKSVSLEMLQELHKFHEAWLNNKNGAFPMPSRILRIDANSSIENMLPIFHRIKSDILASLNNRNISIDNFIHNKES